MDKLACIDVGLKRVGIAFCFKGVITPQNAILRKNRNQAAKDLSCILKEWEIDSLIVGIPLSGSSSEEMQRRIKHFVSLLDFSKSIYFVDEYGSSLEAKERMRGVTKQKKDGKIDSMAACIVLERYVSKNSTISSAKK